MLSQLIQLKALTVPHVLLRYVSTHTELSGIEKETFYNDPKVPDQKVNALELQIKTFISDLELLFLNHRTNAKILRDVYTLFSYVSEHKEKVIRANAQKIPALITHPKQMSELLLSQMNRFCGVDYSDAELTLKKIDQVIESPEETHAVPSPEAYHFWTQDKGRAQSLLVEYSNLSDVLLPGAYEFYKILKFHIINPLYVRLSAVRDRVRQHVTQQNFMNDIISGNVVQIYFKDHKKTRLIRTLWRLMLVSNHNNCAGRIMKTESAFNRRSVRQIQESFTKHFSMESDSAAHLAAETISGMRQHTAEINQQLYTLMARVAHTIAVPVKMDEFKQQNPGVLTEEIEVEISPGILLGAGAVILAALGGYYMMR